MKKTTLIRSVCALTCLFASPAVAEEPRVSSQDATSNYGYEFEDDPLLAESAAAHALRIRTLGRGFRTQLIRPRVQFVAELLDSVEQL